ncbi:MAG: hypothetical protein Q7W45_00385 [Bacteroidota bacterium]|nr:hypothetical protein [Bacteroidota bacterium]MDP3146174.1 hypothetical protein [Bacteroidota bacterium]
MSKLYIDKPSYVINCKNQNFDYLVGGSSRVHNNFNTVLFDSLTGLSGFNIGYGGSGLPQNYLMLYLFLKNGNTIKNYIQQVDEGGLSRNAFTHPLSEYFFMHYLSIDNEVNQFYKTNVPLYKYYIWRYIPVIKYVEYNNYCRLSNILSNKVVDQNELKNKGYAKLNIERKDSFPSMNYPDVNIELEIDTLNIYYLNKIYNLCKEYSVNYVCYTSPVYKKYHLSYTPHNLKKTLDDYNKSNEIEYFDFCLDKNYNNDFLFLDETHLNATGTDVFTKQLADTLKNVLKK